MNSNDQLWLKNANRPQDWELKCDLINSNTYGKEIFEKENSQNSVLKGQLDITMLAKQLRWNLRQEISGIALIKKMYYRNVQKFSLNGR